MRDSTNVLNSLAGHSQDPNYKFERLYRLLFNENLYALAYQKLSQNAGNCTKGTDGQTIDGMSIKHIHTIIEQLKDESYRPCPARTKEDNTPGENPGRSGLQTDRQIEK